MASPEQKPDIDSSWNNEMPWSFYAKQSGDAEQKPTEAPDIDLEPTNQDDMDDARQNHRQYRERDWS
jgi:hypothetical protein